MTMSKNTSRTGRSGLKIERNTDKWRGLSKVAMGLQMIVISADHSAKGPGLQLNFSSPVESRAIVALRSRTCQSDSGKLSRDPKGYSRFALVSPNIVRIKSLNPAAQTFTVSRY